MIATYCAYILWICSRWALASLREVRCFSILLESNAIASLELHLLPCLDSSNVPYYFSTTLRNFETFSLQKSNTSACWSISVIVTTIPSMIFSSVARSFISCGADLASSNAVQTSHYRTRCVGRRSLARLVQSEKPRR
jgi:hypothetical protein